MIDINNFLNLIGFGEWWSKYGGAEEVEQVLTFSDVTFGTLPFVLRLMFIIFLLNWLLGMMSDAVKLKFGGRF